MSHLSRSIIHDRGDFDMSAFCDAVDQRRRERGLTWAELTSEVNRALAHTTSRPISVSTIKGMRAKRGVTSAVALQILRWLGRTPESFIPGGGVRLDRAPALPEIAPTQVLRFDTKALYAAANAARMERGMSWKEVAAELRGFTPNMLTNLRRGPLTGFPHVMRITQWLAQPVAGFTRGCRR